VTSIHAYVWWLKRRHAINKALALVGLRLWLMAKVRVEIFDGGTEMTSWWPEFHRLEWKPPQPFDAVQTYA